MRWITIMFLVGVVLLGDPPARADEGILADLPWMPEEGRHLIGSKAAEWKDVEWLRGGPLSLERLRGRVVLLRFWLTGCPYCTRTAPALNELYRKYRDDGLVVVGLHHPKSDHTRQRDVVREAARELEFRFPIGLDNQWTTLDRYWTGVPGRSFTSVTFLIDQEGTIRFLHDGGAFFPGDGDEGKAYEAMDHMIRHLLDQRSTP